MTVGETNIGASTSSTYSKTRYTVEAKRWKAYDAFNGRQMEYDIGVVYLPENVHRNANTALGYLYLNDPTDNDIFNAYYLNKVATVAGWGSTDGTAAYSDILKYTSVKLIDTAACQSTFSTTFNAPVVCLASPSSTPDQVRGCPLAI